jgi:hypothetical protein
MTEQRSNGDNPYAPPAAAETAWDPADEAPAAHSAVPKVFGILSIIFGSLVLLGGLMGGCMGLFGGGMVGKIGALGGQGNASPEQQQVLEAMMSHLGTIYSALGIQGLVLAAMSGWLLALGIGQLRYRRWACRGSVYWGGAALAVLVGMLLLALVVIGPAYQAMFDDLARVSPSGSAPAAFTSNLGTIFGGGSGVVMAVFYAPYPILLLYYFSRERVRAVMTR